VSFLKWLWEYVKALIKSVGRWLVRYPLAAAATVLVVVGAVLLLVMGKDVQIGGILGKLFGKDKGGKGGNARGVPPKDRVDGEGKPIPPGESDEKGFVQAPVYEIKEPGLFDDPDTVTIVHPDKGKVVIDLPKGVRNKDVKDVVEIEPDVYEVRNNDEGVDAGALLKELGEG